MLPILVADDDETTRTIICAIMAKAGYDVVPASSGTEALEAVRAQSFQVAVLDYHLGDMEAAEVIPHVHRADPQLPVVVISADQALETVARALKAGAVDYATKPLSPDALTHVVRQVIEGHRLQAARLAQQRNPTALRSSGGRRLIGLSKHILRANMVIDQTALQRDQVAVIWGEFGTGRSIAAKAIHLASSRRDRPFIHIACPSIPRPLVGEELFGAEFPSGPQPVRKGMFELTEGGTIFLDDLDAFEPAIQRAIADAVTSHTVQRRGSSIRRRMDIRFIFGFAGDPEALGRTGRIDRELLPITSRAARLWLPPLRERTEDIEMLASAFLIDKAHETGKRVSSFATEVLDFFHAYRWPGNVYELKNVIERLVILAEGDETVIRSQHLARYAFDASGTGTGFLAAAEPPRDGREQLRNLEDLEREHLMLTLRTLAFNKTHAAQSLGISRSTLHRKLESYNLVEWSNSDGAPDKA